MCVIIDNCVASLAIGKSPSPDYAPLLDWIYSKNSCHGIVIIGGKLRSELVGNHSVNARLIELQRAGRAKLVDDALVAAEEKLLDGLGRHKSNDVHVLALARASGARLLCTNDTTGKLERDFLDKDIIDRPRGKIYKRADEHKRLLAHSPQCQANAECRSRKKKRSSSKGRSGKLQRRRHA